jgi:hypothetical protein
MKDTAPIVLLPNKKSFIVNHSLETKTSSMQVLLRIQAQLVKFH